MSFKNTNMDNCSCTDQPKRKRGERGKQRKPHYCVKNIYNDEEILFNTMTDIKNHFGISITSINRKVRGEHGKSYAHLDIRYLRDVEN